MPTVLITGANRGIGREFARQYTADGWRVIATCRDPAGSDLASEINQVVHPLDVTDAASVAALAEALSGEAIDLLINNAGTYGPRDSALGRIDYDAWEEVMRINVLAPIRVAEALAGAVARSAQRRMVFISSKMGSIDDNTGGGQYIYRSSKTALNMAVRSLSIDLSGKGITCLLFHPGWVKTDMGGPSAAIAPDASVSGMCGVIASATTGDNGRFFNYDGTEIAW